MTKVNMKKNLQASLAEKGRASMPKILLAASECSPLSKTGGLADVSGALPAQLISLGIDCRVITPFHRAAKQKYASEAEHVCDFHVQMAGVSRYVGIEKLTLGKTIFYLVDNEHFFGGSVYWGGDGEVDQYCFFQRAVCEAIFRIDFAPDILHCNDWHTALLPMLIKTQYHNTPLAGIKTLLTIHNLAYQGKCGFDRLAAQLSLDKGLNSPKYLEAFGCANILKAGCVFADGLNTVSPTYAREIRTAKYGEGLEGLFFERQNGLKGILNGIDKKVFDPKKDAVLPKNFSAADLSGKAECKAALLAELGMNDKTDAPLIGMVTRITEQKGFGLLTAALPGIMDLGVRFVLLGAGDKALESKMRAAEGRYKGRFCAYIGYNGELANRIYAASDFFLMPSIFEPCGISQMLAMRYGALPIVRETGGLKDTVTPYNQFTGEGTGFSFSGENAGELYDAVKRAVSIYGDKDVMSALVKNAMAADFGIENTAYEYGEQYIQIL